MTVRPQILSEVFTNLGAAWFGLILITPGLLVADTVYDTVFIFTKTILGV